MKYTCKEIIIEVFAANAEVSVSDIPSIFPAVVIDGNKIFESGYEEVIEITDPENVNIKY